MPNTVINRRLTLGDNNNQSVNYIYNLSSDSSSYINYGNVLDSSFAGVGKQFSFEIKLRRTKVSTSAALFARFNTTTNSSFACQFISTNQLRFIVYGNGTATNNLQFTTVSTFENTDNYITILISYNQTLANADKVKFYVNGVLEANTLVTNGVFTSIQTSSESLLCGALKVAGSAAQFVAANVQFFKFYNTAVSSTSGLTPTNEWKFLNDTYDGTNWSVLDSIGSIDGASVNVRRGGRKLLTPQIGTIISDDFIRASLGSNYSTSVTTSTIGISGNKLNLTGGNGTWTNYTSYSGIGSISLENYFMEAIITPTVAAGAATFGVAIGFKSVNSGFNGNAQALINLATGGTQGKLVIYTSDTVRATSTAAIGWSTNDQIRLRFYRVNQVYTAIAQNITTGAAEVTISYTVSNSASTITPNNSGYPTIFAQGGTQDITSFIVRNNELRSPKIITIGDSITVGYNSASVIARWSYLLSNVSSYNYVISAGCGDTTTEVLSNLSFITTYIRPTIAILMIGGNDVAIGTAEATIEANYLNIRNQLSSAGITVVHCLATPRDSVNMTTFNTFLNTLTGLYGDTVINTFDSLTTTPGSTTDLKAAFDSGDGTHPNAAGNTEIASLITTAIPTIV